MEILSTALLLVLVLDPVGNIPAFLAVLNTSMPAASMLGLTLSICRHSRFMLLSTGPTLSSATQWSQ